MEKIELVFVPTPGMGHLLSTVELAKLIVSRHPGISVLVLIFKLSIDTTVDSYVESQSRHFDPSRVSFHILPPLPNPPHHFSPDLFETIIALNKPAVIHALEDRVRYGLPRPAGFVLDMFCTSMMDVADELNVPSYIYFTSGAGPLNSFFHFQSLADDTGVNIIDFDRAADTEFDIPGFRNRVPCKVIPSLFFDKEWGNQLALNLVRGFRRCNGILINTFMELESYPIQTLLDQHDEGRTPAVYPVGPILELDSRSRGGSKSRKEEEESIMQWLDEQPDSSVVFLCFGSMGSFDAPQVQEIANGLDRAGYRFLWSLRRPPPQDTKMGIPSGNSTYEDALPEGFLERTASRGKIIGWAPQVSILSHGAVGGFVSHCGWNSTLESIWFGVPMATWPMYAEQQLNAFMLVKEVEIAVEIKMDYERDLKTGKGNMIITAEEVENGVKKLMSMDEETKAKWKKMSQQGKKALQENGSSHHWLGCFIADVFSHSSNK